VIPPLANIFQPLIDVFDRVIVFFHDSAGFGWGAAIIALTVTVRALLLPLAVKQFHSMQALQRHAPELKVIQARYKNDKQRQQQAMMEFYRENKVNPFGSCLPLLAQMPVFLALFYMLREDLRIDICGQSAKPCDEVASGSASFLFIPDLTNKATGMVLVALLVMYVGSQLISSILMAVTADKQQRMIFIALPFLFVPFIFSFPAGLLVYWITTNLWTVGQQYTIRKLSGWTPPVPPSDDKEAPARAAPASTSAGSTARRAKPGEQKGNGASADGAAQRTAAPPSARKKKKRSGRRR